MTTDPVSRRRPLIAAGIASLAIVATAAFVPTSDDERREAAARESLSAGPATSSPTATPTGLAAERGAVEDVGRGADRGANRGVERVRARAAVALDVTTIATGLDHPWDIAFAPDATMFVTERDREQIVAYLPGGEKRVLASNPDGVWHSGETGLMSLALDPDYATNRTLYVCHGYSDAAGRDVRVTRWTVDAGLTAATQVGVVVAGFPSTSGRHGGCRIRFAPDGALYIGTGDAATGTVPQDKRSLGGKTLRVDPDTGLAWPGNPWASAKNANKRLIYSYGHRNVQGLAWRPAGEFGGKKAGMWEVEHGTYRDDEVNRLVPGGNYGYNPVPGYDESVPMTDFDLPGRQVGAKWSSGRPTIAPSGATWLAGAEWGEWRGSLFMSVLGARTSRVLTFDKRGKLTASAEPAELKGAYGRLRGATLGPDGAVYVSTDNGGGNDVILRVAPKP